MSFEQERTSSVAGRKKSVADEPVTSVLRAGSVIQYSRELTADEEVLAALGYKPEFKREFSLWTSFCVSFAVLGLLPSFASTLFYGMIDVLTIPSLEADYVHQEWDMPVGRTHSDSKSID